MIMPKCQEHVNLETTNNHDFGRPQHVLQSVPQEAAARVGHWDVGKHWLCLSTQWVGRAMNLISPQLKLPVDTCR